MPGKSMIAALSLIPVVLSAAPAVQAADAQAGKAKFQQMCSQCHDVADWKGKSETQLAGMIRNVASGKAKHPKKPALTDKEISDIAAWASSPS
jgi:mono/diheme cytochrome c family protein